MSKHNMLYNINGYLWPYKTPVVYALIVTLEIPDPESSRVAKQNP